MFSGTLAIILNLLSVTVLSFATSVVLISMLVALAHRYVGLLSFASRKLVLWTCATLPVWVSVFCMVVFSLDSELGLAANWLNQFAHWHHVNQFSLVSWHGMTLVSAFSYTIWSLAKIVHWRVGQSNAMSGIESLSSLQSRQSQQGVDFYLIDSPLATAFTSGFWKPKIYLSTTLLGRISPTETEIILRHELAHVSARDPLFRTFFVVFASLFPGAVRRILVSEFNLVTEQLADDAVTAHYDRLDVAQTLINVARLQQPSVPTTKLSHVSYFGHDHTSVRVQSLVSPSVTYSRWAVGCALLILSVVPFVTVSAVDSLHHIIETVFTH